MNPQSITSRDNPLLKALRKLSQDNASYRKEGRIWVEGDHLARAALLRGWRPAIAAIAESAWGTQGLEFGEVADKTVLLPDVLFDGISGLESPAKLGLVFDLPAQIEIEPKALTVILDRVQDAGNVGSILRSAAAFGFTQIIALKGTAVLWSSKALRAGMGAHFSLNLIEGLEADEVIKVLKQAGTPLLVTSSHEGELLHEAKLPRPCAWVMGHEGQGVSKALMDAATKALRIAQPGGEESLNVAAAAAICLYATSIAGG